MWIDSHCHLQLDDRGEADAIVRRAVEAGVESMICVGTDLETSRQALELASRHRNVYATVGLHPHEASKLSAAWGQLEMLTAVEDVVAVGEAGFDLHYEYSPRDEQEIAFRTQIRIAKDRQLPLVIHTREAWDETFRVLSEEGAPTGLVFHCFTGGPDEAGRAVELGALVSFSGIATFSTADDVRAAAAQVPADRLLVETDSPYLAPVPHRGKTNEPALVSHVGEVVAAARGISVEECAALTRTNAQRVFALASTD